jgi:AAA ATPase domain
LVNKRDNPYTPGAGRKPRVLAGRDRDLDNVQALVERLGDGGYERSLIYSGLRGVGKTVLLMEFDVLASEAGWATTDVQEVGSQPDFRVTFARMAARLLREMSRKHRIKDRVDRALGVVKAFSIAVPGAVQLKLDVEAASGIADSGDPEQDLTELIVEVGDVAQHAQSGALFLIDEMHNLDTPALAAICIAFQAVSRRGLPVALVGAGLPDLQVRLISAKPYADRLFQYRELGRLSDAAARAALVGPAAALGVEFEEEAARRVVRESAGYPYFLQEYGLELWNNVEQTPITSSDLDTVREIVNDSLAHSFFTPRFQLATDTEQRYLAAMAELGEPPYRSNQVAVRYGVKDQRGVSMHRDSLIQKGLIWSPRRGQVDFTVPLFAEFLRDNHPLGSFEQT